MKWTAAMVVDALRGMYGVDQSTLLVEEWSLLTEVALRDGSNTRTIDVLAVRNWGSGIGHQRRAYEVKVSRADFRNETPAKRAPAEKSAHRTFYAAPAGVIPRGALPPGWGLVEVDLNQRARTVSHAAPRTPTCDPGYLVSAAIRRAARAEERIRRGTDEARTAHLEAEVDRLAGIATRAVEARDREITRAKAARSQLMAAAGERPVCADCGNLIVYKRGGRHDTEWVHVDPAAESGCYRLRVARLQRLRQEATGAEYLLGYGTPVEPAGFR